VIAYRIAGEKDEIALAMAEAGLFAHAAAAGHGTQAERLHVLAHDAEGRLVGACGGEMLWGDLYIDLMWVDEKVRGQGIGSEVIRRVEVEAQQRGCFRIHLDTMSFQAPTFYPRLGYREFARLGGYPAGAERIYYVKDF
jgi:ribosomal protein S18 acetylase RimI-like enzyme